jgi:mitogen-activated protein kinase 15
VGKAIFPGTSTLNQIERIIELLGKPKPDEVESLDSPLAANILASINVSKKKSFQQFFQGANDETLDIIRRCHSSH